MCVTQGSSCSHQRVDPLRVPAGPSCQRLPRLSGTVQPARSRFLCLPAKVEAHTASTGHMAAHAAAIGAKRCTEDKINDVNSHSSGESGECVGGRKLIRGNYKFTV